MKTLCTALAILAATVVHGQLSPKYIDWADGPVRHLMTRDETKQWKAIHTDTEARAFIDLFWARRDPTPGTPRNEFHETFDKRVVTADQYFSSPSTRGAMSDPGKVLILLGPPYTVGSSAGAASIGAAVGRTAPTSSDGSLLLPRPTADENRQVWNYAHERKPPYVHEPDFVLVFLDAGKNEWQLAHTERANPQLILQEAVNGLIVSPNLKTAPFSSEASVRATMFKDLSLQQAYREFRSGSKTSVGPGRLTWGEFVSAEGEHFASVQLYVPAGSEIAPGSRVTFFGVLEDGTGKTIEVDEDATTVEANGKDAYVDKSIIVEPGTYTATFGLAADGRILTAAKTEMKIEGLDPAATAVSPLILSNHIAPLATTWRGTDPFTFGGLKVIPKGDAVFTPSGDLWYFVELRHPGVSAQGTPSVQVKVDIVGKTVKGPVQMRIPLSQAEAAKLNGEKDRYAVGQAIPLEKFLPGDYTIKLTIVDTVLGKNYDLEKQFRVQG